MNLHELIYVYIQKHKLSKHPLELKKIIWLPKHLMEIRHASNIAIIEKLLLKLGNL